jgi:hypothetical protein
MDTFDVDKLMRYDHIKKDWEKTVENDQSPEKHKPPGSHARDETSEQTKSDAVTPPPTAAPAPTHSKLAASPDPQTLRRGQRLEFAHGDRKWCAVYWGKDDQGHVIAHKTFKEWTLMRLDLNHYLDKFSADPEPDRDLVQTIEQSFLGNERRAA